MIASIARKWFELNWLRKGSKEIPLPEIVFDGSIRSSGCYYQPMRSESLIGERFYDISKGLIVINSKLGEDDSVLNTIVHEWRHHWQFCTGRSSVVNHAFNYDGNYKESIIQYFRRSRTEMDALLFSIRVKPDDISLLWFEWLMKERR